MNKNNLTALISAAIITIVAVSYFKYTTYESVPGENQYRLANKYLEDGKYNDALHAFNMALSKRPTYRDAHLGKAVTLMQMGKFEQARTSFDTAISYDAQFDIAYANRGILNDREGRFVDAVGDYRKALKLNPDLAKGPGFIWKFLNNVTRKIPTIADRATYLEEELKKPANDQLLRVPELDDQQPMTKKS